METRWEKIAKLQELEKISAVARARKVKQARHDTNVFVEYCFSDSRRKNPDGTPHQVRQSQVHRDFQSAIDTQEYIFGELPRDTGKTTQCVARVLFWLGNNPDELIKIICVSDAEAKKRVREITEHILHNPRVHEVFPHLKPANMAGWTQHAIYCQRKIISKDASVEAYGLDSSGIGGRATRLLFDDVVNPKSVRSEAMREATKETFFGVWLPMVEEDDDGEAAGSPVNDDGEETDFNSLPDTLPDRRARGGQLAELPERECADGAKVVWIGTPWHKADLHSELKAKAPEMGWFLFSRPVGGEWARQQAEARGEVADEFSPVWPEQWGRVRLQKRFARLPRIHFARAYLLQPMSDDDRIWDTTKFQFTTWEVIENVEMAGAVGAWDFAFTEKSRNDRNGYVSVALGEDLNIYVFRSSAFRGGLQKTARAIVDWAIRDQLQHVGMEEVAAQTWMRQYVKEMALLPLRPLRPQKVGGDKISRAIRTQPYVDQCRVYFLPGTEDLQAEMGDFPFGVHDDLVDAFVYCIILLIEYYLMNEDMLEEGVRSHDTYDDGALRVRSMGLQMTTDSDDVDVEYERPVSVFDQVRWM